MVNVVTDSYKTKEKKVLKEEMGDLQGGPN